MKISVIVPVYNAEQYIEKCVRSVINQTYTDWELILVDDGSHDASPSIIDRLEDQDSRITSFHQSNKGAGQARNAGITKATGDYVVFLDADDYIDADYFQLLVPKAKENDMVFIDVVQVDKNGKPLRNELMSKYKSYSKEKLLRSQTTGKIFWGGGYGKLSS